jgi:hypothetical protein
MDGAALAIERADQNEQRQSFLEAELSAYRAANERLAMELGVARRVLDTLPFTAQTSPIIRVVRPLRVPRAECSGDDVLFHIDRCDQGERLIEIVGWAFCPRIDCAESNLNLMLEGSGPTLLAKPDSVDRHDVATFHANIDLGPALPPGSERRARLRQSGFAALLDRSSLEKGKTYAVSIQIDGPDFSVRRSTGVTLHG